MLLIIKRKQPRLLATEMKQEDAEFKIVYFLTLPTQINRKHRRQTENLKESRKLNEQTLPMQYVKIRIKVKKGVLVVKCSNWTRHPSQVQIRQ